MVTASTLAWLDSPAVQPGGSLGVDKRAMLGPFDVVGGKLTAGQSGAHRYGLVGSPGVILQAKVATEAFEPVVAVISPSGARWDLSPGAGAVDGAGPGAPGEVILPEKGVFVLIVTSRENTHAGRPVSHGEYRLTLLCDAPPKSVAPLPEPPPSSRSGRFGAWESDPC